MDTETVIITKQLLRSAQTARGGFTYAQQKLTIELGFNFGDRWAKGLIGKTVSSDWWDRFVAGRTVFSKKTKKKHARATLTESATFLLQESIRLGARFRQEGDKLVIERPGVLPPDFVDKIRQQKPAIIELLNRGFTKPPEPLVVHEKTTFIPTKERDELFASPLYRAARVLVIRNANSTCAICGSRPPGIVLHVDHKIPLTVDWSRRLDLLNLQVLCENCNRGKSNFWS